MKMKTTYTAEFAVGGYLVHAYCGGQRLFGSFVPATTEALRQASTQETAAIDRLIRRERH